MSTKKLKYITNAKIVGIILVVFGHSFPFNEEIPNLLNNIKIFVYCFHMPLFVLISAFLVTRVNSLERHGLKNYILGRAKKLFVPYIFLSLVGILPKILLKNLINDEVEISFSYFLRTFFMPRSNVWGHFWFIPMIFILAFITIPFISLLKQNKVLSVCICILSFGLLLLPKITDWFGLNDVKDYLCWYLLGLILGKVKSFENIFCNKLILIFSVIIAVVIYYFKSFSYKTPIAFLIIVFILGISSIINLEKNKLFELIGKYNFAIFIMSWPAQAVIEIVANKIFRLPVLFVMTLMFVMGIVVPITICLLLNKLNNRFNLRFLNSIIGC